MIFAMVPFHEVGEEIAKKVPEHYEAVKDYGPPNVDWDYYLQASFEGKCVAITARDEEKLVGYAVFFIETNANHKHHLEAINSGLFVDPEYRGSTAIEMFKRTTEFLKSLNVNEINYALKDERIGRLLAREGYKPDHTVWSIKI